MNKHQKKIYKAIVQFLNSNEVSSYYKLRKSMRIRYKNFKNGKESGFK